MIEITPNEPAGRSSRAWVRPLAIGAAVAVAAGSLGFVAGRRNTTKPSATAASETSVAVPPTAPAETVAVSSDTAVGGAEAAAPVAAGDTKMSAAAGGGAGQYSPGAYPESPGQLLAERTAGDVVLRAYLQTYGDEGQYYPDFPDWAPAAWCFPNGNVRLGIASPSIVNIAMAPHFSEPRDGLAISTFAAGYVEGQPMFGAIAQVGPDVTTVTLTAGGASDTAEPQHGIALLIVAVPIAEDFTVSLTRADGTSTATSAAELGQMWSSTDYHDACEPPPPALPAAGEQPADPAAAEAGLRDAWAATRDRTLDESARLAHIDDPTGVAEAWAAIAAGQYAEAASTAEMPIKELVFTSPADAWFRYDVLSSITNFYDRYGQAHLADDGTWLITRQTICQDLALAPGFGCTPPVETLLPPSAANDPRYHPVPEPMPIDAAGVAEGSSVPPVTTHP